MPAFNLSGKENLPRILLVDDDKDHLRLFTMILEDGVSDNDE